MPHVQGRNCVPDPNLAFQEPIKAISLKSESALSRDTLAYAHGSVLSRVNLLVSFSAWAELVWRYRLEVTNTVNRFDPWIEFV